MALHCKTPPLRVSMVDRLSPIDRNLKSPQSVRQNSQTAVRRRRLRVGRSHWGGVLGGRVKKRSRNRFGVLLVSGRFKDRTAHRKCGWVLLSLIDSKDE